MSAELTSNVVADRWLETDAEMRCWDVVLVDCIFSTVFLTQGGSMNVLDVDDIHFVSTLSFSSTRTTTRRWLKKYGTYKLIISVTILTGATDD